MLQLRGWCCSFNRLRTGSASASQGWPLARAIRPLSNASVAAHERNMHPGEGFFYCIKISRDIEPTLGSSGSVAPFNYSSDRMHTLQDL